MDAATIQRRRWSILGVLCLSLFVIVVDNTVVNVALPTISRELDAGVSELQWIVDGYVLVFASLLLTGGIAGDRYGRKKIFMAGLAIFTLASALCGLSQSTNQLIAARAFQGVGAALLMPGTLSIITVTFPPHERAKAIGLWAGMSGSPWRSVRRSAA
jgi:Arabinose efflux permease